MYRIVEAEERYLPQLVALCGEHAAYEGAIHTETGKVEPLRRALFSDPPVLYGWLVLGDDSDVLGFTTAECCFSTWDAQPFVHMDCLYVREEARGKGLGRSLVERVAELARDLGCSHIQWQTPPDNELGIGFYKRIGARGEKKLRFFYNVD